MRSAAFSNRDAERRRNVHEHDDVPGRRGHRGHKGIGRLMKIRVGVVGFGYWGPNLVRNFSNSERFDLVAIADRNAALRAKAGKAYPGTDIAEDASELIGRPDIQAVVIATPVASHYRLAFDALKSGKHVLVEKPMCASVAEAKELVEVADKAQRVLMVNHTFLFTGAVKEIIRLLKTKELGKICYFDSMRVNLGLFQPDVNCLWDLAPHDLSIINHVYGGEVADIDISGYCHVNPSLPDMVYMTLHYQDNVVAHFNLSWMSPVKVRRFAVGGTEKMLIWDDLDQDQKIKIYNSGIHFYPEADRSTIIPEYRIGDIYSPRIQQSEALTGVVDHFAQVIAGQTVSIMDGRRGLHIVRILEDAQRRLDRSLADIRQRQGKTT
jgi:predicted dehydrogenase